MIPFTKEPESLVIESRWEWVSLDYLILLDTMYKCFILYLAKKYDSVRF